jgi:hypothetical protein
LSFHILFGLSELKSALNRLPILPTNPNDQSVYNLLILKDSVLLARGLRVLAVERAAEKICPQRAFSAGRYRLGVCR